MPSAVRVASLHMAAWSREACIVAAGRWGEHKCLFKNRDRNYTPKIRVYHELIDGTEVLYLKDEVTGWCEGLNEHGIGIVNAALAVGLDESEKDIAKGKGKGSKATLRDGERVRAALSQSDIEDAVETLQTFKNGLRGHTFVADADTTYSLEATWRGHDFHVRKLSDAQKHVRTNHGQFHQDAGYTEDDGDSYLSSLARRDQAMKVLREVEDVGEIAPSIYGKRRVDLADPLNMVKLTDKMRTTSQMVLDLTDLTALLYLIPGQVEYLGYERNLPKGREPKLKLKVLEYTDIDGDGDFDVLRRRKSAGVSLLPILDPAYNVREVFKQLVLLEDHLFHPRKRCSDCIWKHLLTAEALAEEAVTLDIERKHEGTLGDLAETIRLLQRAVQDGVPLDSVAQKVREVRKGLLAVASRVRVASVIPFAPVQQETGWTCGAAALRAVLAHVGVDIEESVLAAAVGSDPDSGTEPEALMAAARALGIDATIEWLDLEGLRAFVDVGVTPILNLQAWGEGHFVVAVGFDDTTGLVLVADPYTGDRRSVTYEDLEARWVGDDGRDHLAVVLHFGARIRVASYFEPGDVVTYGKFQNKPGKLVRIFQDGRGIPMIEIEPVPKGRKKNRVMSLYRIRHADPAKRVASQWLARYAAVALPARPPDAEWEHITDPERRRWMPLLNEMMWLQVLAAGLRRHPDPEMGQRVQRGRVYDRLQVATMDYVYPMVFVAKPPTFNVARFRHYLGQALDLLALGEGDPYVDILIRDIRAADRLHFPPRIAGTVDLRNEESAAGRIAGGKFKEKKKVKTEDGDERTVYVYSERQVQNRNREKAERVENLRHSMADIRKQVRKDLGSSDPKTRLTALAVALIDATFERVGNDGSADEGHFGVTGWLKKHVTFGKGTATVRYVGKSGVKHEKVIDDAKLVKALKGCCEDKGADDPILSFGAEDTAGPVKITSREVNAYLKPFDVTAKDLRGFHANREMQERLREVRRAGPELPRARKDRDKILKAEFKEALEATAKAVGHEASTLRTQYLVPGLEDSYVKDGTVNDNLKDASVGRVAAAWLQRVATKSPAEREDEEVERLVRPSPKQKPPRNDSRRERIEVEDDPDLNDKDKDLSLNYKDTGG